MSVTSGHHPLPTLALLSQPCTAGPRRTLPLLGCPNGASQPFPCPAGFLWEAGHHLCFPMGK